MNDEASVRIGFLSRIAKIVIDANRDTTKSLAKKERGLIGMMPPHSQKRIINHKIILSALFALILFSQSVHGFYAVYDLSPPGAFVLLSYILIFWLVGDWFTRDSKANNIDWAFDMGFFLYISWPIFIPFYLYKTRGLRISAAITIGYIFLYSGTYYLSYYVFYAIMT